MICMPGFIWGEHGCEAYKRQATGEGSTFRERKGTRVSCEVCGGIMAASFLRHHMDIFDGRVFPQVRGVDVGGGGLEVYRVSFPRIIKSVECPMEGCPTRSKNPGMLRENIMFQQWKSDRVQASLSNNSSI